MFSRFSSWFSCFLSVFLFFLFLWRFFVLSEDFAASQPFNRPSATFWPFSPDLSDVQWRSFRAFLPLLLLLVLVHFVFDFVVFPRRRRLFSLVFSFVFLFVAHGFSAIFPIAIALANFFLFRPLASLFPARLHFVCSPAWFLLNLLVLDFSVRNSGFSMSPAIFGRLAEFVNNSRGILRWEVYFNLMFLRIFSFHFDSLKAIDSPSSTSSSSSSSSSSSASPPPEGTGEFFSLANFFLYLFFPPLYFAGPIQKFSDFLSHFNKRRRWSGAALFFYGLRVFFAFLLLEFLLSHYPIFSAFRSGALYEFPLASILFAIALLLCCMWLKFLVIWRFFRFWSLCLGIEAPENMPTCFAGHSSIQSFWRGWHASFNRWLTFYLFVPMGGSDKKISTARRWINIAIIFAFVALWHERNDQLMFWGLGMAAGRIAESALAFAFPSAAFQSAFSLIILFSVNFIGYSAGFHGVSRIWANIELTRDLPTLVVCGLAFLALGFLNASRTAKAQPHLIHHKI